MAVFFRHYQNNNPNSKQVGKWYERAVITETVNTDAIAEKIQRNCTVKKSDVKAVITELVEVMQDELQASKRVKLDGFGSFKISIKSAPADSLDTFSVKEHIKGLKVLFQPETKVDADNKRVKTFLSGCTVAEAPKNAVDKDKENTEGN